MSLSSDQGALGNLHEFINGSLSSEECFCMVLSLLGEEKTKREFHNFMVKSGLPQRGLLWKQLHETFSCYFSQTNDDCLRLSEASSFEADSFGERLDLELAIALSETDTTISSATSSATHRTSTTNPATNTTTGYSPNIPTYASKIKHTQKQDTDAPSLTVSTNLKIAECPSNANFKAAAEKSDNPSVQNSITPPIQNGSLRNQLAPPPPTQVKTEDQTSKRKNKKKKKKGASAEGPLRHVCHKPVIYWLRRDLRLHDNPALVAVFESGAPVVLTFVWSEREEGPLAAGGATKVWLHLALAALDADLHREYNNRLVFRRASDSQAELTALVSEVGAGTVVMSDLYEPGLKARDDTIAAALQSQGVAVQRFHSYLLHEPGSVSTDSLGLRGLGSVTHFMELCRQSTTQAIGYPADKPPCLPLCASRPHSQPLGDLGLARMPRRPDGTVIDWAKGIRESWDFSEAGAWAALDSFVEGGIRNYEKESGRADERNTSRISPYLHWGQVSPRSVLRHAQGLRSPKFLRKLAWRDLSYWLLTKFPDMDSRPIRVHYQSQRWSDDKAHLKAWQRGNTGFPLVDAAMRELWLTGWMNNYTRHVVASFLISYLHLHWLHGYAWFQDTLLDADVAINAMMWQNGGMSGPDQWNFVMHPVDAALTCDPCGRYVRRWCPELSRLPDDFVHRPWKCPPSVLRRANVTLGENYPHRILTQLEEAREQSLHDVVTMRLAHPQYVDKKTGNDLVPLPSGLLLPVITRKEFKYRTAQPSARDNPHTAVLKGYRSRKRDETIAHANLVDFTASTLNECALRHQREQSSAMLEL